jgi:hypothetical protein
MAVTVPGSGSSRRSGTGGASTAINVPAGRTIRICTLRTGDGKATPTWRWCAPCAGLVAAEERRRLFSFIDADKIAIGVDLPDLIRFAIGSGLRVGELCAVRWMGFAVPGCSAGSPAAPR